MAAPWRRLRTTARAVSAALSVVALGAGAFLATPASAFTEPGITGTATDFANCPANIVQPTGTYAQCIHAYTTGGFVQIGHSSVPISIPGDTFDLGTTSEEEPTPVCALFGGEDCTVSPAHGLLNGPAQPVPAGLLGALGDAPRTAVRARLEWAAPVPPETAFGNWENCISGPLVTFDICNFFNGKPGTAATLKAKVHLLSPFLGPDCYIGSAAEPIVISLTTGTTSPPPPAQPITGRVYESLVPLPGNTQVLGVTAVNNSFSVPAAHGCGTSPGGELLDSAINHKLGLPSPAGHNTIVVNAAGEELGAQQTLLQGWTGESLPPEAEEAEGSTAGAPAGPFYGPPLPDHRAYELVSPVQKNGEAPYAAVPSTDGEAVDFQARGALAGAGSGGLNLYRATRGAGGWQSASLTPTPVDPLGALELQAPVWTSGDLSQTIFTTPASYDPADSDNGALSLYGAGAGGLNLLSTGTQGGSEEKSATFDAATPDGQHVVFSSGASFLPEASGLELETTPEAQYLYERDVPGAATHLLGVDNAGHPAGYAATTFSKEYELGSDQISVATLEGFAPGQVITVGSGPSAQTTTIQHVFIDQGVPLLEVVNPELSIAYPAGTPVLHRSEGAVLGDGANLASAPSPAAEYAPANAGSGTTTNAISTDGSRVFFESPSPTTGRRVALYLRKDNASTVKIAGGERYGSTIAGTFPAEFGVYGSARFEGAAANGSLAFFTSEEGLAGATIGKQVYEFNTTEGEIGGVAPMSVGAVSAGRGGDKAPVTTLTSLAEVAETLTVASTAGFHAGEEIAFGPIEGNFDRHNTTETGRIVSVDGPTQLTLLTPTRGGEVIAAGTEIHGLHPASVTAISNDGSHVYFVSDGVLAENQNAQGAEAVPVKPNLYLFDTQSGETTFIATLAHSDVKDSEGNPTGLVAEPDISRPAVPTPNGKVLAFASAANLTGQNPAHHYTEIYRYSEEGETLECLSCTAPGIKPTGNANFGETAGGTYDPPGLSSPISEDGSQVFFDTPDSLAPGDANAGAPPSPKFEFPTSTDVYEWQAGTVSLISSGTGSTPAVLQGVDPSGRDVLFNSTSVLVPGQSDGGYENVFDARAGGGFPEPGTGAPSCAGSGCREAFGPAPVFPAPATQGAGDGNPSPAQPKKKHPKNHRRKHHAKKRANKSRRATR